MQAGFQIQRSSDARHYSMMADLDVAGLLSKAESLGLLSAATDRRATTILPAPLSSLQSMRALT